MSGGLSGGHGPGKGVLGGLRRALVPRRLDLGGAPRARLRTRVSGDRTAVVVGGGIAGVAAAVSLAERGVRVTLLEKQPYLGGRAGAWTDHLANGEPFEMERGFHAFFRQYYNLRSLLRRVDPGLRCLVPLDDYPLLGPGGASQSFADLSRRAPLNLIQLVARTPTIKLTDLPKIRPGAAFDLLGYDAALYERLDAMSAKDYLDSLHFPPEARQMLFEVFAHSFFNPEERYSAGELLLMFHFYFTGNPEGLVFDVAREPFSTAIWKPFERYLRGIGVDLRLGVAAARVARQDGAFVVETEGGAPVRGDACVLATTVPALRRIVDASPDLRGGELARRVGSLDVTLPFSVWRLWLDRPTAPGRAAFVGTAGLGLIDNVSCYHLFESESRDWAARTGGSVVELHAYAVPEDRDEASIRAELLASLHGLYPELRGAKILEDRFLHERDCPSFAPGSHALRPGVVTDVDGLALAGDYVRLDVPTALMERAATSGFLAASHLLGRWNTAGDGVASIPARGVLAPPRGVFATPRG